MPYSFGVNSRTNRFVQVGFSVSFLQPAFDNKQSSPAPSNTETFKTMSHLFLKPRCTYPYSSWQVLTK